MAKQLENISFRSADNGAIVSVHTTDTDSDGDTTWDTEEHVFLDENKTEMKEFISQMIDDLI